MASHDTNYQSVQSTEWTNNIERSGAAKSRKAKWIVIGSIVGVIALIAIGVGVGVGVSQSNKSSGAASGSGSGPTAQTDPNDASTFTPDSNLKKAFYGIAYTPEGSLLPDCGSTLDGVIKDMQLLSQITNRVRLYGSDCNQTALVLEAIKQTKVDMNVWVGNYIDAVDTTVYERQRDYIKEAIETYGTDHISGITVGNEFMLNYLTENGANDPNGSVGDKAAAILIANIDDTRSMLSDLKLDKDIPVGTSDAGSFFATKVLEAIDYGLSNVHPWFANTTIDDAAAWTNNFFNETNVEPAALLSNKPQMYIAETGWPSKSSDAGNANNGASDASVANLQKFMDNFVCEANDAGTKYFYFELFDEKWKDEKYGGVEGWWGLFNSDRTLKDIKIPDCTAP